MKYRHALAFLALALGLGGCASTSPNYRADTRDGSYYSPADAGYGDYYYAPEPRYDYYYDHSYFYGSPFWHDPFLYPYYRFGFNTYYGWYDPFWGPYAYYPWYDRPRHDHDHDADEDDDAPPSDDVAIADENPRAIDGAGPRRQIRQRWFGPLAAASATADNNLRLRARTAGEPPVRSRSEPEPRRNERSSASDDSASAPSRPSRRGSDRGGRRD